VCALIHLTINDAENKTRAGTAGAIEAVTTAMRAHAGSTSVQEAACMALRTLTINNEGNRTRAGTAGAIEAVAVAMRAHAESAGVQQAACWALIHLIHLIGTDEGNKTRAGTAGAVEAIVAAMRAHAGSAGVQEAAVMALKHLIRSSPENIARAANAGAVEAVMAALHGHAESELMKSYACSILLDCGAIHLNSFETTLERDVPLGVKLLKVVAQHESTEVVEVSRARDLLRAFAEARSCNGCGSTKARTSCSWCVDAGRIRVRYCDRECQRIHWCHPTASHRAECEPCATASDGSSAT